MKKFQLVFILCLSINFLYAQQIVTLTVNQSPEFDFSVSKLDTSIVKGESVVLGTDLIIFGGSGEYQYSWSHAATLNDSTIVNPLATPTDTTIYMLTVTDSYGCSFSMNYIVNVGYPVSNGDLAQTPQILNAVLFPNPSDGKFKMQLTGKPARKIKLAIFNNNGKVVKRHAIRNFTGNHTETFQLQLVTGVYILHIDSGTETLSHQFIVQ